MDTGRKKKLLAAGCTCVALGVVAATLMGMAPGGGGPGAGGGMRGGTDDSNQKTVVEVESPVIGSIAVTGSYVGTVEPGQQVTIYPKVSGEVLEVNFQVGDTVQAGDILFRIDSTSLEYSIAQTQASLSKSQAQASLSLEQAKTNLENYTNNVDEGLNSSLLAAENAVLAAENNLQTANNDYRTARQKYSEAYQEGAEDSELLTLRSSRVSAELKVESAQLTLENAKASLEAVKKQVQESAQSSEYSVRSAELSTNFSAEYISLQSMQNNLGDYTVTSPISGVVEQRSVDPYDMASSQSAAYVISNKDMVTVTFNVAESALGYMEIGDRITLEKNGETCLGTVSEVSSMVDGSTGLYTVKATVANAPFEMRSGSTIKLYADNQKVENEMLIPIDAVYYESGSPYVYVFENNTSNKVMIETGIADATHIQVVSGLSISDEIIVTWSASLIDGAEVYLPGTAPVGEADDGEGEEGEAGVPRGEQAPPAEQDVPGEKTGDEGGDAANAGAPETESGDDDQQSTPEEDAA